MKFFRNLCPRVGFLLPILAVVCVEALSLRGRPVLATDQQLAALTPLPGDSLPRRGTFWLMQGPAVPLPFLPTDLGPVSIYDLGAGHYMVDDRSVDYAALSAQQLSLRDEPSMEFVTDDLGPLEFEFGDYPEGSLWLEPQWNPGQESQLLLLLHGSELGVEYKILGRDSLQQSWLSLEAALLGSLSTPSAVVWKQGRPLAFWQAVRADADTDSDRMPDWWESANGLNPAAAADAFADPDGDGVDNLHEYANGSNPHAAESLLEFVAQPKAASFLP